jgi:hypothetical protein
VFTVHGGSELPFDVGGKGLSACARRLGGPPAN